MAPRIRQVQLFADERWEELAQGEQVWAQVQTIALTRRSIFELKLSDLYYALESVVESWTISEEWVISNFPEIGTGLETWWNMQDLIPGSGNLWPQYPQYPQYWSLKWNFWGHNLSIVVYICTYTSYTYDVPSTLKPSSKFKVVENRFWFKVDDLNVTW